MQDPRYNLYDPMQSRLTALEGEVRRLASLADVEVGYQSGVEVTSSHAGVVKRDGVRWYIAGAPFGVRTSTNVGPGGGVIWALPMLVGEPYDINAIGVSMVVANGAGSYCRLGAYDSDHKTLKPGRLLREFGEVDLNATGLRYITISPKYTLRRGLSWIAFTFNNAVTSMRGVTASDRWGLLGHSDSVWTSAGGYWSGAFTYGALPSNFPGTQIGSSDVPSIGIRPAS